MGELTFGKERFSDIENELRGLIRAHWEEVAVNKEAVPLDPAWDRYEAMEEGGFLHVIAARSDGRLVGYGIFLVDFALHYRTTKTSEDDSFYLQPEHRGNGFPYVRLFRACEAMLAGLGVKRAALRSKELQDMTPVLRRLGYRPVDRVYCKLLET